mmetsp:Transcript_53546/g.120718  ORF Transcript_53546/g.120718 Transcript_53546/m.120718 type:complete len:535 (+) Transcript_53546:86-1690(+)
MGCGTSVPDKQAAADMLAFMKSNVRPKYSEKLIILSIKDQNSPGKMSISGDTTPELEDQITALFLADEKNKKVLKENDKYDVMYDVTWRNTCMTTGHSTFSLQKSYFPRGKLFVSLMDLMAKNGWALAGAPNFGGVESRDDKGNVTSCVDWPVFVFYEDKTPEKYAPGHLLLAVKDSNMPGKLCAAGPILGTPVVDAVTAKLQEITPKAKNEKDSYDDDFDVVWRETSITSGMSMMSFAKSYFPKGKTNHGLLQTFYEHGWRAVAAPNFGGQGDSWPCVVLRKLAVEAATPEILFASIKDSNVPGKLCLSGPSANRVAESIKQRLSQVGGNADVKLEKDSYDDDHDEVVRNINITTGMAAFSLKLPYFPRCDSMLAYLEGAAAEGFTIAACPNFGGMVDSWPTFIFEQNPSPGPVAFLAVKDDNIPGKVNMGGGGMKDDPTLEKDMLDVLVSLGCPSVKQAPDDYDKTFDLCFKHTVVTSGNKVFTWAKPYYPHGFVVEAILRVLLGHGWMVTGGPNFGNDGLQWPGITLTKVA